MAETPYTETEILLAVIRDEEDEARAMLDGMNAAEIYAFSMQVQELAKLAGNYCSAGDGYVERGDRDFVHYTDGTGRTYHKVCHPSAVKAAAAAVKLAEV